MKWFKHISDSLDDPFIFDLMSLFGSDGYLVFFGVLEIYSREFKTDPGWKLKVSRSYLRQKLHKRQDTIIIKCLRYIGGYDGEFQTSLPRVSDEFESSLDLKTKDKSNSQQTPIKLNNNSKKHIQNSGKWEIDFIDNKVVVFIPKFRELIDEWTQRKIGSKSGVSQEKHELNKNKEEEVEVDKEKNKGNSYSNSFLRFYENYPIKKEKQAAWKMWKRHKPDLDVCLNAIKNQVAEKIKLKEAGQFCAEWKNPATWINKGCWEDEIIKTEDENERDSFLRRHRANV